VDPSPPPSPTRLPSKVSNIVLLGIAGVGTFGLAALFAYILVFAAIPFETRLWWTGFASWVFALAFYLLSAAMKGQILILRFAGGFFLVGAAGFYGSIFLNPDPVSTKIVWLLVLSGLVVALLAAIFVIARGTEADAERRARRKVTP